MTFLPIFNPMNRPVFWLFCTVIDNYGDIGVSWRLAQELHTRLGAQVYLWLDDFAALQRIVPTFKHSDIHLQTWQEGQNINLHTIPQPHVVIETFACRLPENVVSTIHQTQAIWLNWEYLSAEDWAVRTHTMHSLQTNGSTKYFWQMGFHEQTGGLLREANYLQRKQTFRQPEHHALTLFLFGYESPIWANWFQAWQQIGQPLILQLSGEQIIHSLKQQNWLPENAFKHNNEYLSGSLKLQRIDFVPQTQFDELLWAADMLLIRGEDSFVRAQWAGKPFLWHIYPQAEHAHLDKLHAFWRLPQQLFSEPHFQAAFDALSGELNGAHLLTTHERITHWQTVLQEHQTWQQQATQWCHYLSQQSDTISRLVEFLQKIKPDIAKLIVD